VERFNVCEELSMFDLALDIRYAFRRLAARPGYTAIMLVTLALAIAVSTAVFTVVDETLLRRAPFAFADRLVDVMDRNRVTGFGGSSLTPEKIAGWQDSPLFERLEGYTPRQFDIAGDGEPERVPGMIVTTGLFPMLGVQPALGRGFSPDEGRPGSPRVVIIDEGLWKRRFGGDRDVLGRTLALNDNRYTIIGVMPRRFHLLGGNPRADALWLPVDVAHPGGQAAPQFYGVGRLRAGTDMASLQRRADTLADEYQKSRPLARVWDISIAPKRVAFVGASTRTVLLILLGAVGFVLLIAFANVANLLLSRASARAREMAVRSALGASRGRLIRETLVESVIVALIGGAAGVVLAIWIVPAALALAPPNLAGRGTTTIEIDLRVLAVAVSVTLAAGILVGLVPALRGSRPQLEQALRASSLSVSAGRTVSMSGALVVVEVALALVLLVGATLLMRTFSRLHAIDPGFDLRGLVTTRISLPSSRYPTASARLAFEDQLAPRLAALPGVSDSSVASIQPPPAVGAFTLGVEAEHGARAGASTEAFAQNMVAPNYFQTLRIPFRAGRTFSAQEGDDAAIVSQAVADSFWPGVTAVGKRLRLGPTYPWLTVVGVVGNVEMRIGDERLPRQVYTSKRAVFASLAFTMRTGNLKATASAIKALVWAIDRNLPIDAPVLAEDQWNDAFGQQRFALQLMGAFALVALLMAAGGVFAVLSQLVSQRTREIGVRVALGASPLDVFRLIVARGMIMTLGGVALGLAGAALVSRVLTTLLFGVGPYDPASFAGMSVVIVAVAFLACWLPTRRAMRVEPAVALRVE
jgi:putative ABC transport system permease protein